VLPLFVPAETHREDNGSLHNPIQFRRWSLISSEKTFIMVLGLIERFRAGSNFKFLFLKRRMG